MRSTLASLAALALSLPADVLAQPISTVGGAGPDTYLELHVGGFVPQSDDVEALDAGVALGASFGARFTPNLSAELELAYYRASGTESGATNVLSVLPVTASVRLRYPLKVAELSAFAGGGLHLAYSSFEAEVEASDYATAFGLHVGGEAAFNLSPTMRVGFEVRRTFVNAEFDGADVDFSGVRLAATLGYHF